MVFIKANEIEKVERAECCFPFSFLNDLINGDLFRNPPPFKTSQMYLLALLGNGVNT